MVVAGSELHGQPAQRARGLMWKTARAERTDTWPDADRRWGRSEELTNQVAAGSAMKPCLRSILIQRGAFLATLSAS